MDDADPLNDLAAQVADGDQLEWGSARTSVSGADLDAVEELRIIAEIARLHRAQTDPIDGLSATSAAPAARSAIEAALFKWGGLRVLERLGAGSFGEVYRAWDGALDREVALKLLRPLPSQGPRASDSIIREGQLLARVHHPHVMAVYGAQYTDDRIGIWGELLHGRTLADIVRDDGPLSAQEACLVVDAVCRALTAVHRSGLLHRDIKAQNVMREPGGRIVLMDFGLGREADLPGTTAGLELAGTPLYLAPELFLGEPASAQSDVYSVGVLLFYLVTGRFPIEGGTIADLARAHREGKRSRLQDLRSDLPGAFVHVVERAITAEPSARFESAGALQAALARVMEGSQAMDAEAGPAAPLRAILATAVLTIAVIVAGVFAWQASRRLPVEELVTFTRTAPDRLWFTEGDRNVPAISPDGRYIAFIGTDTGVESETEPKPRVSRLYIWSFAERRPRPVAGSENAAAPFWAPDSQSLAFFTTSKGSAGLYRVSVSGARSESLISGWESRGGTWNNDDVLLLATEGAGLQRFKIGGGKPAQVTAIRPEETAHKWPQFLSDGKRFIFFIKSADPKRQGVYVGSLDGEKRRLVASDSSALVANGYLLFVNRGALFAQPFDERSAQLGGTPQLLVPQIEVTPEGRTLVSTSDTGRLIYTSHKDLRQLTWYDLDGHNEVPAISARFNNPALSPDRALLAVEWNGDWRPDPDRPSPNDRPQPSVQPELRVFTLPSMTPLEVRLPESLAAVWGPNGLLAFSEFQSGGESELFVTVARTNAIKEPLLQSPELRRAQPSGRKEPTDWSRDGRLLVYQTLAKTTGLWELWLQPTRDGRADAPPRPLFNDDGLPAERRFHRMSARFSPNGRWLAYTSFELRNDDPDVYVQAFPSGEPRVVSLKGGYNPIWRNDGSLLFLDTFGRLCEAVIPPGPQQPLAAPRVLFPTKVITPRTALRYFDVSADGRRVLVASPLPSSIDVLFNWTSPLAPR